MAIVKLILPGIVNTSLQAKPLTAAIATERVDSGAWDVIYFARIDPVTNEQSSGIYRLGVCVSIASNNGVANSYTVHVEADETAQTPLTGDFVFFGKENKVNISGVRGYFAEVEMINDSSSAAKLFSVGSEMTQSSK